MRVHDAWQRRLQDACDPYGKYMTIRFAYGKGPHTTQVMTCTHTARSPHRRNRRRQRLDRCDIRAYIDM